MHAREDLNRCGMCSGIVSWSLVLSPPRSRNWRQPTSRGTAPSTLCESLEDEGAPLRFTKTSSAYWRAGRGRGRPGLESADDQQYAPYNGINPDEPDQRQYASDWTSEQYDAQHDGENASKRQQPAHSYSKGRNKLDDSRYDSPCRNQEK